MIQQHHFWYLLKRTETAVQTKTCTWTFTAALFIKAKRGKQPKCSSTGWINKQNVLYPYSGVLLIHKKGWSRHDEMVEAWKYYPERKMSDIRSHIRYDSSYINIQNGQIHRNRKQMSNFQGWEEGKVGCDCLTGTGFPFGWWKCSGTRFVMFYTTLWMHKMSLMAGFVFCVFYYIRKELTWFLKKKPHRRSHPNSRDSVDMGWDSGTYILGGEGGSCPGGFWCYYNGSALVWLHKKSGCSSGTQNEYRATLQPCSWWTTACLLLEPQLNGPSDFQNRASRFL